MRTMKHLMLATAAAAALTLAGCGGGGSSPVSMTEQQPTPYETAKAAIAKAGTAAEAQAAVDAAEANVSGGELAKLQEAADARQVELVTAAIDGATTAGDAQKAVDDAERYVSGAELAQLQAAADARKDELATMASEADQKAALMAAAGMIDTSGLETAADIAAANADIAALKAALAVATDVSDADKAMYQARVTAAETAVASAQSALDHAAQTMVLADAVSALQAIDLGDLSDEAKIDAAEAAVAALQAALDGATELSDTEKAVATALRMTANQTVMAAQGRMDVAGQMMALAEAKTALDAINFDNLMTQAQIDAANAAIVALDLALAAATGLTDAQTLDATVNVTVARRKVEAAETVLAENVGDQRKALTEAGTVLAAIDLADLDTADKIAAAQTAVDALKMALEGATHLSDGDKAMYQRQLDAAAETVTVAETGMERDERMAAQRMAVTDAVTAVTAAVAAVNDTATDDQVMAADNAIADLKMAIDDAEALPEGDIDVAAAERTLTSLMTVLESAKTSRTAAMEAAEEERRMAEAEEERKANEARAATAAKLHAGISMPTVADAGLADTATTTGTRFAQHAAAGGANAGDIEVAIGDAANVFLSEDKDASIADNAGWEGKRYTRTSPATEGMYEAIVYSKIPDPIEGSAFNVQYSNELATNTANPGEVIIDTSTATVQMNVASSQFDQLAGLKTFKKPENTERVMIPGSYHGVSGTYYCAATGTTICASRLAIGGFELGTVASPTDNTFTVSTTGWNFKPDNLTAKVMGAPVNDYASYGWWLHTAEDGGLTASAFVDDRGTVADAAGIVVLRGSATYMGGAAGKYALSSSTGGTNDAGHFTARAMLEADFNDDTITGTIDNFMGVGGAKDWSVELKKSALFDNGDMVGDPGRVAIDRASPPVTADEAQKTVWTIDGTAATPSGAWSGALKDNGDDGVPSIATGTFYSTYGNGGKMVGAFGTDKQ